MASCYIIYSSTLDRYYVGSTHNSFESRLKSHNSGTYKSSYTSQVKDWKEHLVFETKNYSEARRIEMYIKKMKSRTYIENLKKYPEVISKLKSKIIT